MAPVNSNPDAENHTKFLKWIKKYKDVIKNDDTICVWFNAEEIQKLVSQKDVNGIRIYFVLHDGEPDQAHLANKRTVIIAATTDSTNPGDPQPETSKDMFDPEMQAANTFNIPAVSGGTLCPPRCTR
jgi:hypothetical protein